LRSQLAATHGQIISLRDENERAKGNLRQYRFVRKTEKASLDEDFAREEAQLVNAVERALMENDMHREKARSAHAALRDAVGRLQSFQAPPQTAEKRRSTCGV
jgi:uncharacterized protein YPO0396